MDLQDNVGTVYMYGVCVCGRSVQYYMDLVQREGAGRAESGTQ